MSDKILITGASGFLGTALCKRLEADGHALTRVSSKVADLTQSGSLDKFNAEKFDKIFHLAAWTQAGDFCLKHPGEQWVINQRLNTNVLDWWQRRQPQAKLISMGTSCSYDPALPLKEEFYMQGIPIESLYTYAMTKRMLYAGQLALRKQYGLRYLTTVPSTLYGPGYHTDGRQMHFIFDLIRKILRAKLYGEEVVLWGDGHQKRELVFIDDFISILLALDARHENDLFNIGGGEEYSIRQFAGHICELVGYDAERIRYDTSRYVGAKSKVLDVGKLRAALPGTRMTPLREGLSGTIDWFMANRETTLPPVERR